MKAAPGASRQQRGKSARKGEAGGEEGREKEKANV